VDLSEVSCTHRGVIESLHSQGVGVALHYIPIHTQPYYRAMGFRAGDFPKAEQYYGEAISLPLYPKLDKSAQDQVVVALRRALNA